MITKFTGDGLWFTSDTHFNHAKILEFCDRNGIKDIQQHDKLLIDNWNSVVKPDDTIFHLGDFCFGGTPKWREVLSQLNGHIYLIRGNHDDKNIEKSIYPLFEDVLYQARILVDGRTVYLNHFPFLCYGHADPKTYGQNYSIQLFGHVHSSDKDTSADQGRLQYLYPTQYDVGVDNNNLTPISYGAVKAIIEQQVETYLGQLSRNFSTMEVYSMINDSQKPIIVNGYWDQ